MILKLVPTRKSGGGLAIRRFSYMAKSLIPARRSSQRLSPKLIGHTVQHLLYQDHLVNSVFTSLCL